MRVRRLQIVDVEAPPSMVVEEIVPTPEMGRNLDTVEKTLAWLQHPSNWISSRITLIKWDGLIPRISAYHGKRLRDLPDDNDMARTVCLEQKRRRMLGKKADEQDDVLDGIQSEA